MSRYIDVDVIEKDDGLVTVILGERYYHETILKNAPTAEVAEVVRCRDCSWHKSHDYFRGIVCTNPYFEAEYISVDEEFYCANGTTDEVSE